MRNFIAGAPNLKNHTKAQCTSWTTKVVLGESASSRNMYWCQLNTRKERCVPCGGFSLWLLSERHLKCPSFFLLCPDQFPLFIWAITVSTRTWTQYYILRQASTHEGWSSLFWLTIAATALDLFFPHEKEWNTLPWRRSFARFACFISPELLPDFKGGHWAWTKNTCQVSEVKILK